MRNKSTKLTYKVFICFFCISFTISAKSQHRLYLDSIMNGVTAGTNVSVSLRTQNFKDILGFQGSIVWDTTNLTYNGVSFGTNSFIQLGANDVNIASSYISFFWIDPALRPQSTPDTSILLTINFIVKKDIVGYNSIKLSNSPTPIQIADSIEAMPVTIKSFKGIYDEGVVKISWSTANEMNVANYVIQHSTNGINFTTITTIPATNNLLNTTYNFSDVVSTDGGMYYRLITVDRNGSFTNSKTVKVMVGLENPLSIYPNPASNILKLHFKNERSEKVTFQVINTLGKIVYQQKAYIGIGSNDVSIDISNYPKGSYFVVMNGHKAYKEQFNKN